MAISHTRVMKDRETYGRDDERHRHLILLDVLTERFRIELWHEHYGRSDQEGIRKEHHDSWCFFLSFPQKRKEIPNLP